MKKSIFILISLFIIISCSEDNLEPSNDCYKEVISGVFFDQEYCDGQPGIILIELIDDQEPLSFYYNGIELSGNTTKLDANKFQAFIDSPVEVAILEIYYVDGCKESRSIGTEGLCE